jgi:hypothetical protein
MSTILIIGLSLIWLINADILQNILTPDYNYSAVQITPQMIGNSYLIQSSFPIIFQGINYTCFYLNTNGYLTVDGPIADFSQPQFISSSKILIGLAHYFATNLTINTTSNNLTIHYHGKPDPDYINNVS